MSVEIVALQDPGRISRGYRIIGYILCSGAVGPEDTQFSDPNIGQDDAAHTDKSSVADLNGSGIPINAIPYLDWIVNVPEGVCGVYDNTICRDRYVVADSNMRGADNVDILLDIHVVADLNTRRPLWIENNRFDSRSLSNKRSCSDMNKLGSRQQYGLVQSRALSHFSKDAPVVKSRL